jgi:salicylate biosynthesis isochorismate synthase/menaquinone-specific isochorismate synthase
LAWWDGRQPWIAAFGPTGATVSQLEARLDTVHEVEPYTGGVSAQRAPCDRAAWTALVEGALGAIAAGRFSKVVGARVIDVTATQPYPERAILKALEARHKQCWSFLVRGRDGRAFVGASPETLCEAHEDILVTEALAGTAAGGQGTALLRSEKDRREHAAVVDAIRETLTPFSLALEVANAPVVKVLSNVDHLHTPIRAKLKPGVSPLEVARALHPTPAVGGTPREAAMSWLRANEGFERGWYTGVVGAMGPGRLTLAVALRAALVDGAQAQVFVGAGLVEGSTPDAEWLETERKARAMLPALGVNDG